MSTFTVNPNKKMAGFGGKKLSVPMYLQFTPGYCSEVLHSSENNYHETPNHTNSIIAIPHHSEKIFKTKATSVSNEDRYYPLFRTSHDIPTKGDSVLLTNIGGINYYLGPLNMDSNNPTWNPSRYKIPELSIPTGKSGETTDRGEQGESLNFNKSRLFNRLAKVRKTDLDYGKSLRETTGDFLIEGRHGNSLRVGSRNNNPYIFISNKRAYDNEFESLGDGTLISITSNGTLQQHFGGYVDDITDESKDSFQLDSDALTDTVHKLGDVWSDVNGQEPAELYNYNTNQLLVRSNRITFNTKSDDIIFSSRKDTHIATGRHMTFTTSGGPDVNNTDSVIFQTSNLNIGNPNNKKMQPMVLGKALQDVLVEIVNMLGKLQVVTSLGVQTPLTLGKFAGDVTPGQDTVLTAITNLETKIENILSTKHSIEENTSN